MSLQEKTRDLTLAASASLAPHVPELTPTIDAIYGSTPESRPLGEKPFVTIARTYIGNLRLIKSLAEMRPGGLARIAQINEQSIEAGIPFGFSAKGGADYLLDKLGPDRTKDLLLLISSSADLESPIFKTALADLTTRMTEGHVYATQGLPLGDGKNAASAHAIWGHAKGKGLAPLPDMHLTVSHGIAREFAALHTDDADLESMLEDEKDVLLCAMGDVLMMQIAQGQAGRLGEVWSSPKPAGLGWLSPARQELFNKEFAEQGEVTETHEVGHHGKPLVRQGESILGTTGMRCQWEYHSLEEYMTPDTALSFELLHSFATEFESLGLKDCQLTISDSYPDDPEGDPHYMLDANYGNTKQGMNYVTLKIQYFSKDPGQPSSGTITVRVGLRDDFNGDIVDLVAGAFVQYDDKIVKYYPDPEIEYRDHSFDMSFAE